MDKTNGQEMHQLLLSFFCPHFDTAIRNSYDDPHTLMELYDADNGTLMGFERFFFFPFLFS